VRAVLLEPTAVAVHAVLRRPAVPGERVLVVGAGSIGLLTVAALAALCPGAEVHCVARHAFQAERAASMGARPHLGGKGLYPRLAAATGARYLRGLFGTSFLLGGFDQVIDTVGTAASLAGSLRWVKAGGRVLAVGASFRRLRIDLTPLWYQEVELLGVDSHAVEADGRTTFDIAAELLADSAFPVDGLVTHRFRMDDWPQAVRAFTDKRSSGAVKIVLEHRAAL
jgi:threonine dehydrogenase-like Zn-dependent dehydrogenase